MTTALIDLEPIVYRAAWAAQKKIYIVRVDDNIQATFTNAKAKKKWLKELQLDKSDYEEDWAYEIDKVSAAIYYAQEIENNIKEDINPTAWEYYLPDKEHEEQNFRMAMYPEYKANRRDLDKPEHFDAVVSYFKAHSNVVLVAGMEADDALGIASTQLGDEGIIVTIDKDLDTVPGYHYNPITRKEYYVAEEEAKHYFYNQVITGDASDNIIGIKGIGPVKADKVLAGCSSEVDMWSKVLETYRIYGRPESDALLNARLLHLLRHEAEIWQPPLL